MLMKKVHKNIEGRFGVCHLFVFPEENILALQPNREREIMKNGNGNLLSP